jgi:glycine cleavage system transcriptional repressor
MKLYRILSASGSDRPGIVHQVSQFVFDHHCNMEDSRMAVLGGQFSLMTLCSGEETNIKAIEEELPAFQERTGLTALMLDAISPLEVKREPSLPVRLEVVAMDAPGIMVQIAKVLDKFQVNVETLDAHLSPAPTSGTTVSSVKMKVAVPQTVSLQEVKDAVTALASQINLDVVFQPVQE